MPSKLLDSNAVIIAPNQLLAGCLQKNFGKKVLPLNAWLVSLWQRNKTSHHILLSYHQEQAIWHEIVDSQLFDIGAIQSAWRLSKHWGMDVLSSDDAFTDDLKLFQHWAKEMALKLAANNWLDEASITGELVKKENIAMPSNSLIFVGFDRKTSYPLLQSLLKKLESQGNKVEFHDLTVKDSKAYRLELSSFDLEIVNMALWAKQKAQMGEINIGCVVSGLGGMRSQVERLFHQILPGEFSFLSGKTLRELPLIYDALHILAAAGGKLNLEQINLLLHSPFTAGADTEYLARSILNSKLQASFSEDVAIRDILALAKDSNQPYHSPILAGLLDKHLIAVKNQPYTRKVTEWLKFFEEILAVWGWPGESSLTAEESLQIEHWQKMLTEEVGSLELLGKNVTLFYAWQALKDIAGKIRHQSFTTEKTAVKILNEQDASGLIFDYLWVTGLSDSSWPRSPQPNPFLPVKWQKKLGMPGSCYEEEKQYGGNLIAKLATKAKEVVFSYSSSDENPPQPSAFISSLPIADWSARSHSYSVKNLSLETIVDEIAPQLSAVEARGGSKIFKLQAACPFRAFAELRLGAIASDKAQLGLSAVERGNLVHSVLAAFWGKVESLQQLNSYGKEELNQIIKNCVRSSLDGFCKKKIGVAQEQFFSLEARRLERLLTDWLLQEKDRPDFTVVKIESKLEVSVGNLPKVTCKIDRMDKLSDGSIVIIDYKTGRVNKNDWQGERPEEPQLLLYCIANCDPVDGIAFAQLKNHEFKFDGIAQKDFFAGIAAENNWQELKIFWRNNIIKLANEFAEGQAKVDPKDADKTCRYCHLLNLCRYKA